MNHQIDADNPNFFFLPKFAQAFQDFWAEEITPVLLDHSCFSIDTNTA